VTSVASGSIPSKGSAKKQKVDHKKATAINKKAKQKQRCVAEIHSVNSKTLFDDGLHSKPTGFKPKGFKNHLVPPAPPVHEPSPDLSPEEEVYQGEGDDTEDSDGDDLQYAGHEGESLVRCCLLYPSAGTLI
jgi:hypothetical protein